MACPQVLSGDQFLVRTLAHLDCQAQTIGSFGFQSLAAPGSQAALVLTGLLTLFVAFYGIRLMFGLGEEPRDLVNGFIKLAIVLTLAASWPAWRVLAYDTVLYAPADVAAAISPSTLPDPRGGFAQRLQGIDNGLAEITYAGTGRLAGEVLNPQSEREFQSVVLPDSEGYGWARPVYLATTIGSLGGLRIAAGLLLALAPLFAGLLLFEATRGLFIGWLRALAFVALGSLGVTLLLAAQVAIMEPWVADILARRNFDTNVPMAPTEALAFTVAFAIAIFGMLFLLAKLAFQNIAAVSRPVLARLRAERAVAAPPLLVEGGAARIPVHSRAVAISESVEASMRRESAGGGYDRVRTIGMLNAPAQERAAGGRAATQGDPLGSSYRRGSRRDTASQRTRDDRP